MRLIRFIYGKTGSGKTTAVFAEMEKSAKNGKVFLLVPDREAVAAYYADKAAKEAEAKAKADAEAAEKARLEREANPTTEDLLKEILACIKKD